MRKAFIIVLSFIVGGQIVVGQQPAQRADSIGKHEIIITDVEITAQRKLSEAGITKTEIDTIALHGSVITSIGDVLMQSTPVFIKSYGRGSVATASFRGTAPSHTQVLWNGIKLNSPMMGMVDFSLVPSYFVDQANLFHGAGSVGITEGGFGGAITLDNKPTWIKGRKLNYTQGISSFDTYDQFLRYDYGRKKFSSSYRLSYSTSRNDFPYTNFNDLDDNGNYPTTRNKNGQFKSFHFLKDAFYQTKRGGRLTFIHWFSYSDRNVPLLNSDTRDENRAKNKMTEKSVRVAGMWDRMYGKVKLGAKAGTSMMDVMFVNSNDIAEVLRANTSSTLIFGQFSADYFASDKLILSIKTNADYNFISSAEKKYPQHSEMEKSRIDVSVVGSAKYSPTPGLGIAADIRALNIDGEFRPVIPALLADYLAWPAANLIVRVSAGGNYRNPSPSDLYSLPAGNPYLKSEHGFMLDAGMEMGVKKDRFTLTGDLTVYNSQIRNWIAWLPSNRDFMSPLNIKRVHCYGIELKGKLYVDLGNDWKLNMHASWAETHSINHGDPVSPEDQSVGKQLVYVPVYSASVSGLLNWRKFSLSYKYYHYSERFTTSSNTGDFKIGLLKPFHMNDISIERSQGFKWADISVKLAVYNLFNEHYVSVLSRPMPRRNFGLFISVIPKW